MEKVKKEFKGNVFTDNDRNYPEMIYKTGTVTVRSFVLVARVTRESNYAIYCELNSYEPVRVYMGTNGDEIPSGYHRTKKEATLHGLKMAKNHVKCWEEDHYMEPHVDEACYPESEATEPIENLTKVYDKGHPILWEIF